MKTIEERKIELIACIKAVFLFTFVLIVFMNTLVLCAFIPLIGYHLMPNNQVASELWSWCDLAMVGCMCTMILCVVAYATIVLVYKYKKNKWNETEAKKC